MRVLRFDLERRSLEYYFHELYQAFDPGVKNVLTGEAQGVLTQRNEGTQLILSLHWESGKVLKRSYQFNNTSEPLENSIYKGFLYDFLSEYFEKELKWGTLTGIKPVRIVQKELRLGLSYEAVFKKLRTYYRVGKDRAELLIGLAKKQEPFFINSRDKDGKNTVGIYIGIPLCPSKCTYCSFTSTVVDEKKENLNQYFKNLIIELNAVGKVFKEMKIRVDSVYIGGGTPTVLSEEQLEFLLIEIQNNFDLSELREYTLEAGRSETISEKKLSIAKEFGVERICLNPQSMNGETLKRVGRYWEKGLVKKQRDLIKEKGFKTLNMDLILGLPGETEVEFMDSLEEVLRLDPENITIHNLSIKRGSSIKHDFGIMVSPGFGEVFYQNVRSKLKTYGYDPYYLYRLKYTQGNSENIGYSKKGYEGIYNIMMMAESQSIIGIGAGSTGKLYDPNTHETSRVFTMKDIKTYNERINEVVEKKTRDYKKFFLEEEKKIN